MDYANLAGWTSGIILYILTWKISRFFISRIDYEVKSPAGVFMKRFFISLFISLFIIPIGAGYAVLLVTPKSTDTTSNTKAKISSKTKKETPAATQQPPLAPPQAEQVTEKITDINLESNKMPAEHTAEPASSPG